MIQSFMQNKKAPYAVMVLVAVSGMAFFLLNAHWGIGVDYDSLFYMNSAQNLLAGNGLKWFGGGNSLQILTHYPPLYPVLIAFVNLLIPDPLQASTWLGALLFAVNILLVGIFVYGFSRNFVASLIAMFVIFLSPDLVDTQLWAMSETLFFVWMLLSLILLISYINHDRGRDLLGAAIAAAFACLTRYVGVTIVLTGLIALLIYKPGIASKLRSALVYGAISLIPLGLWYLRNYFQTGSLANRDLTYHQITKVALGLGYRTVLGWFFPFRWAYQWKIIFLVALGLVLLAWFGLYLWKLWRADPQDKDAALSKKLFVILLVFFAVYTAFMWFSMTYVDASTRLNERILSPLHLTLLLLFCLPVMVLPRRALFIGALLAVLSVIAFLPGTRDIWSTFRNSGLGLSSKEWRNSPSVQYAQALAPNALIYSNEAVALQYQTGLPVYSIPQKFDKVKREDLVDFESNMALMRRNLQQDDAYLILFKARKGDEYPSVEILSEGLTLVKDLDDGLVYQYQP